MDGTVTEARRDEGRPALAGTGVGTGATRAVTGLDLAVDGETAVGIVTDLAAGLGSGLETEMGGTFTAAFGTGLVAARVLDTGSGRGADWGAPLEMTLALGLTAALAAIFTVALGVALTVALTKALDEGFGAGCKTGLVEPLAAALAAGFTTALATSLVTAFATGFALVFATGLATAFAIGLATACLAAVLADGFAAGWAGRFAALLTAGVVLPDFVFTSCLLAGLACACSADTELPLLAREGLSAELSVARECTGLRVGKPISCKSETIMELPNLVLVNV